jgi:hypothetical protein
MVATCEKRACLFTTIPCQLSVDRNFQTTLESAIIALRLIIRYNGVKTQRSVGNASGSVTTPLGAVQEGRVAYTPVLHGHKVGFHASKTFLQVLGKGAYPLQLFYFAPLLTIPLEPLKSRSSLPSQHPPSSQSWSWSTANPSEMVPSSLGHSLGGFNLLVGEVQWKSGVAR